MGVRSEHGLRTHLADSLDTLARLVADRGDHAQAARLTGAVDAARRRIGYPRPPADLPPTRRCGTTSLPSSARRPSPISSVKDPIWVSTGRSCTRRVVEVAAVARPSAGTA
jgi:hypothetical protein